MVTGLTYDTYKTTLAGLAVVAENNADFNIQLPSAIDYAELRCYQELDLLSTVTPLAIFSTVANQRAVTIPLTTFITIQDVNVLTPVGTSDPNVGTRNPCTPTSKEVLDFLYPSASGAGVPQFMAMANQNTIYFGPWPDQNYGLEIVGTVRPASLASTNQTTFLSTYLPSMFLAASMVYISGYQRNFGRQSDDPQMSQSWETQYQLLKAAALPEEMRKKFQSSAWSSQSLPIAATPGRDVRPVG